MTTPPSESSFDPPHSAQFFSHPESPPTTEDPSLPRPLANHLRGVAARGVWVLTNKRNPPPESIPRPTTAREQVMYVVGWLHDIGKANPYFQRKLGVEDAAAASDPPPVTEMTYHSRIGGFLTYYCLTVLDAADRDRLAGYLAVAKHHGRLPNAAEYITTTARADDRARDLLMSGQESSQSREELLREGWCWALTALIDEAENDQLRYAREFIDEVVRFLTAGAGSFDDFASRMRSGTLQTSLRSLATRTGMVQPDPDALPEKIYGRLLALWSCLTLADKSDVMGISNRMCATHLSRQTVTDQIDALGGEEASPTKARLNTLREQARKEVVQKGVTRLLDEGHGIGEITLPTGLGKTLTGLEAALKIREHCADPETDSRVIYALPYTSIIEQTRTMLERPATDNKVGFDLSPFSTLYTIHHHLSETITTQTGEEPDDVAAELGVVIAEAWRSGLTLTTFAQLFESLTGPRNSQSMKLPALTNSVIILDEPQTIPYRWWRGAARILRLLIDEFDATVLLMTATQPRLPEMIEGVETTQLVEAPSDYLTDVQRVTYELDESVLTYAAENTGTRSHQQGAQQLVDSALSGSSVLSVCNTVASARQLRTDTLSDASSRSIETVEIGRELAQIRSKKSQIESPTAAEEATAVLEKIASAQTEDEAPIVVGHLTSRHRPLDRRVILEVADALATQDVPFVFVTTQLIEAGVDVSFQSVYRDLAPLESIIQAGGRCNRSFEWGVRGGTVVVWRLAPPSEDVSGFTPGEKVYAQGSTRTLLRVVAELLVETVETRSLDESTLDMDTMDAYFRDLQEGGHSEERIAADIKRAQVARLGETRFIAEDVPTQDIIVPESAQQHADLQNVQGEEVQSAVDFLEQFVDYRVSIPLSDGIEDLLTEKTAPITDDLDVRLLLDTDSYSVSSGLQFH